MSRNLTGRIATGGLIVLVGVLLLIGPQRRSRHHVSVGEDGDLTAIAVFGGAERRITTGRFAGGEVVVVAFGTVAVAFYRFVWTANPNRLEEVPVGERFRTLLYAMLAGILVLLSLITLLYV